MSEFILARIAEMCDSLGLESDSALKSLRGYKTHAHPLLIERLGVAYRDLDYGKHVHGRTFTYHATTGTSGSQLMNYLLQSFYDQEMIENNEAIIIYPKLSVKTQRLVDGVNVPMRDCISEWVSELSRNNVAGLRNLVSEELTPDVTSNLLDDFRNSDFASAVLIYLRENGMAFPAAEYVHVASRVVSRDLVMKCKYYPARDDKRSYCQDTNKLRCLVGACLNRLIVPKAKGIRSKLFTASIIRPFDKDMLKLRVIQPSRDDRISVVIVVDISNFTGSFGNAWLMLFCMALDTQGTLRNKYQYFAFGDKFLLASWHEILALYTYLTVGYPCYVEDLDQDHCLPGGFLGVNANITTGLLCLAFILNQLRIDLRDRLDDAHVQAGGDDTAFAISGTHEQVDWAIYHIRKTLEKYVGQLKELTVVNLEDGVHGEPLKDIRFCRKRIILKKKGDAFLLSGEESIPIPCSILPGMSYFNRSDIIQAWRELDLALLSYERTHPDSFRICDAFRAVMLEKYPILQPFRQESALKWPSPVPRVEENGIFYTKLAYEAITQIEEIRVGNFVALQTMKAKARQALHSQIVFKIRTNHSGVEHACFIHNSEKQSFKCNRQYKQISILPDEEFLVSLNKLLNS